MWTTTGRSSEWHRWQWGWWEANRTALHRALGYHRGWQGRKKRENQVQTRPMLLSLCWLEGVLPFKKQHEAEGNDYLLLLSQLQKLSHLCVLPVRSHKCCLLFLIVLESWFKIICIKKKRGGAGVCNSGIHLSSGSVLPLFSCCKTGKTGDILIRNLTILHRFQAPSNKN